MDFIEFDDDQDDIIPIVSLSEEIDHLLSQMDSDLKKGCGKIDYLKYLYTNKKGDESCKKILKDIYRILNAAQNKARKVGEISCCVESDELMHVDSVPITFIEEERKLQLIFDGLLPKRLNAADKDRLVTYKELKAMYLPAFMEFTEKREHKTVIDGKVLVHYIHHYASKNAIKDVDNFETKFITDMVTALVRHDDNPGECSIITSSRVGDRSYSEVIVMPMEDATMEMFL